MTLHEKQQHAIQKFPEAARAALRAAHCILGSPDEPERFAWQQATCDERADWLARAEVPPRYLLFTWCLLPAQARRQLIAAGTE
jgi:hypothetical protein